MHCWATCRAAFVLHQSALLLRSAEHYPHTCSSHPICSQDEDQDQREAHVYACRIGAMAVLSCPSCTGQAYQILRPFRTLPSKLKCASAMALSPLSKRSPTTSRPQPHKLERCIACGSDLITILQHHWSHRFCAHCSVGWRNTMCCSLRQVQAAQLHLSALHLPPASSNHEPRQLPSTMYESRINARLQRCLAQMLALRSSDIVPFLRHTT